MRSEKMLPKYNEMYKALLESLKDGKEYTTREYREKVAEKLNISKEEKDRKFEKTNGNIYNTTLNWTCVYLKKAGLISSVKRGVIKITGRGLELLKSNPLVIDNETLKNYKEFVEFITPKSNKEHKINEENKVNFEETPQDIFEKSLGK